KTTPPPSPLPEAERGSGCLLPSPSASGGEGLGVRGVTASHLPPLAVRALQPAIDALIVGATQLRHVPLDLPAHAGPAGETDRQGCHLAAGADLPANVVVLRKHLLAPALLGGAFDSELPCLGELQRPEDAVEEVAAHVAQRAGAEVAPGAPAERVQAVVVFAR